MLGWIMTGRERRGEVEVEVEMEAEIEVDFW